jgi:hypothetical protein
MVHDSHSSIYNETFFPEILRKNMNHTLHNLKFLKVEFVLNSGFYSFIQ